MQQEIHPQNGDGVLDLQQENGVKSIVATVLLGSIHLMPLILFAVVAAGLTSLNRTQWHHSLWISVLYGAGGAMVLIVVLAATGANTWFELGVRCTFLLVLILILFPIFQNIRAARLKPQHHVPSNVSLLFSVIGGTFSDTTVVSGEERFSASQTSP